MLVLSRKEQQRLLIGGDVEVVVLHVGEKRVRLGISAPEEVSVRCEELAAIAPVDATPSDATERPSGQERSQR